MVLDRKDALRHPRLGSQSDLFERGDHEGDLLRSRESLAREPAQLGRSGRHDHLFHNERHLHANPLYGTRDPGLGSQGALTTLSGHVIEAGDPVQHDGTHRLPHLPRSIQRLRTPDPSRHGTVRRPPDPALRRRNKKQRPDRRHPIHQRAGIGSALLRRGAECE